LERSVIRHLAGDKAAGYAGAWYRAARCARPVNLRDFLERLKPKNPYVLSIL
jgi:hypothetical protein